MVLLLYHRKGEKVYEQSIVRQSIHNIMNCLSKNERQVLERLLIKIRESSVNEIKRQSYKHST